MAGPDPRFFLTEAPQDAGALLADIGLSASGGASAEVTHAAALAEARPGALVFVEDIKTLADAKGEAALVLCRPADIEAVRAVFPAAIVAKTATPRAAFAALAGRLHRSLLDVLPPLSGIAETASIAATAEIAPSAVIGPGAIIHDDVRIGPFAVIGPGVAIGAGTTLYAHVSVTHAVIGAGCTLSAGVKVGEAGFGYVASPGGAVPIPQLGRAVLADRVDLGAGTMVDRGALGDTVIGAGTKIDNLCQIAHNCRIGANCLIASQTGVSGSVVIGDGVMIGGQAGMAGHLNIGDGAVVTARAGLMRDVPAGERWGGIPARPVREWMKETAALSRLARAGRAKGEKS